MPNTHSHSFAADFQTGLGWFATTVRSILAIQPWKTSRLVTISLLSQVGIIVAFVLPLKVIIMLGSPRIPRYFPDWFHNYARDELIYGLSATALAFYLVHLASERSIAQGLEAVSKQLVDRVDKITTRPNQSETARSAYEGIIGSLSGMAFFTLASIALGFLYPSLLIVLAVFLLAATSATFYLGQVHERTRQYLHDSLTNYLGSAYAIGFLSMFGFVVADFLLPIAPPGLIFALFGFVMGRQILAGASASIQNVVKIYRSRRVIEDMFFHGPAAALDSPKKNQFWSTLHPGIRDRWLQAVIEEIVDEKYSDINSKWHQTGSRGIAAFEVEALVGTSVADRLLVRTFDTSRIGQATREHTLLSIDPPPSFAPLLVGTADIGTHHVHVFDWQDMSAFNEENPRQVTRFFNRLLLELELSDSFVERYSRTLPYIWQRINVQLIRRLRVAAGSSHIEILDHLEHCLEDLLQILRSLPLQVVLSRVSLEDVSVRGETDLVLTSWTHWHLEPVGCGWPIKNKEDKAALLAAIDEAAAARPELTTADPAAILVAAHAYELERLLLAEQLSGALLLVPLLLEQVERVRNSVLKVSLAAPSV